MQATRDKCRYAYGHYTNMEHTHTFPKSEKLCGQLHIDRLYKEGKHFSAYPLRVTFRILTAVAQPPQVLIWAPKRLFRRANKRNRMRRLMREAYRLNAGILKQQCADTGCSMQIAFNCLSPELCDYPLMEKAMKKAVSRLNKELDRQPAPQP